MDRNIDPALFNIIMGSYDTIAREMAVALERSSWSSVLNSARDFSTVIMDGDFRTVAVPEEILPGQALGLDKQVKAMADFFPGEIHDGDVLMSNLPYLGCLHMPEIGVATPVFFEGEIVFWAAVRGHQVDMGSPSPTRYPYTRDMYGEGLKIPPIKIYEKGKAREDVINLYLTNLRCREHVKGDLMAHIAATWIGKERLLEFLKRYGKETVKTYTQALFDYTDRMVAAEIKKMKEGTYYGEDWIDSNHFGTKNIPVKVKLTVKDDMWIVDFSDCGPQLIGGCNCTMGMLEGVVASSLGFCISPRIPKNYGLCRHYQIIAPEGCIVNAQPPFSTQLATTEAGEIAYRAVLRAAVGACPEMVPAGVTQARPTFYAGTDYRESRNVQFVTFDINGDGGGGAAYGVDGCPCMLDFEVVGGMKFISIEMLELLYPMIVEKAEIVPDSMGAGKWRGAPGCYWEVRFYDCSPVEFNNSYHGDYNPPYGVLLGNPGLGGCSYEYDPKSPEKRIFHSPCGLFYLQPGRHWVEMSSGGGGYGDPLEREPALVSIDVRDDFITLGSAKEQYGVILHPITYEIDYEATTRLRNKMKSERRELPLVSPTEPGKAVMISKVMTEKDEWMDHERSPNQL